ncbi:MAG: right-handed parallel beta-helix repeat-containing protein [Candidatus Bipolaricaulota bacterium]|nr:right-handed parallel beta-helix repeat-containing protein [Candidatus Bipolaricaulota bacterium]MDW8141001.1 right-handed parallel beta-helix repeat-containing protein [Candidatus Bipolaricaulota bacterium]
MRIPVRIAGIALILALFAIADSVNTPAQNTRGSVIFVDCTYPVEMPYQYKTLTAALQFAREGRTKPRSEFGVIVVAPCTYKESLTGENAIDVKGLQWISRAGRDKTKIIGSVEIKARNVLFVGFDVDANQAENAIKITGDNAALSNNKFRNAAGAGVLVVGGADGVVLLRNEIFNNGGEGLKADEASTGLRAEENKVRSNGSIGVFLGKDSDRAILTRNEIILNRGEGVLVSGNDGTEISSNQIAHNAMDGIKLDQANGAVILKNSITTSGVYGVTVQASDNNEIRENEIFNNSAGGVSIKEGERSAKRNTVQGNRIYNNARAGAEGLLLSGDVSGNNLLYNALSNNGFGVKLVAQESGRAPSNNTFTSNAIKESQEEGIFAQESDGRNTFRSNELEGNNGHGVYLGEKARNDTLVNNTIKNNGKAGVFLERASRHTLRENFIIANGDAGVVLDGANDNTLVQNQIRENEREGVKIANGAKNTDLTGNLIEANQWYGVFAQGASDLDIRQNTVTLNYWAGVLFQETSAVTFERNRIVQNRQGGVDVGAGTSAADLEFNDIVGNQQFGLRLAAGVEEKTIRADRNWWGDPNGPSGVFEGRGNAAVGIRVNRDCPDTEISPCPIVLPWLLAPMNELLESSVMGWIIRKFGNGRAIFDATNQADTHIRFFDVDISADGVVIVGKYRAGFPEQIKPLETPVKVIGLLVNGVRSGTVQLEIEYTDAELKAAGVTEENKLCLLYLDRATNSWKRLENCFVKTQANIVLAEIPVALLNTAPPIALATGAK